MRIAALEAYHMLERLFLGPLEQSAVDERALTCALPLVPLLLTQGLQSPVESVRTPVLATISRLVQLPAAPALLLRSTAESGAVGEHSSLSGSGADAVAGAGGTLLEQRWWRVWTHWRASRRAARRCRR